LIMPVVGPRGTVVLISELETTLNVAAVPLKVTLVAPVRLLHRMFTAVPTLPEAGMFPQTGPDLARDSGGTSPGPPGREAR
jgi:hypothetical protein